MEKREIYETRRFQERYSEIKDIERISITEAKQLYSKAMNTNNSEERKKILNEIIQGTLYVVYSHLKNNMFEIINSSTYDIDDIINTYTEYWINGIYNGVLEKNVNSYLSSFFKGRGLHLLNSLNDENNHIIKKISSLLSVALPGFLELERKLGRNPSEEELAEYCETNIDYIKLYHVIDYINIILDHYYDKLFEEHDYIDSKKLQSVLNKNVLFMTESVLNTDISNDYSTYESMEDIIINKKIRSEFSDKVKEILYKKYNKLHAEIFLKRFGLYDGNTRNINQITNEYHITREALITLEMKILFFLRRQDFSSDYKNILEKIIEKDKVYIHDKTKYPILNNYISLPRKKDVIKMSRTKVELKKAKKMLVDMSKENDANLKDQLENERETVFKTSEKQLTKEEQNPKVSMFEKMLKNGDPSTREYEVKAREAIDFNPTFIKSVSQKVKNYEALVIKSFKGKVIPYSSNKKEEYDRYYRIIVKYFPSALTLIPTNISGFYDLAEYSISYDPTLLKNINDLLGISKEYKDEKLVNSAINIFSYLEIIRTLVNNPYLCLFRNNRELINEIEYKKELKLEVTGSEVICNKEKILQYLDLNPFYYSKASDDLKNDSDVIRKYKENSDLYYDLVSQIKEEYGSNVINTLHISL